MDPRISVITLGVNDLQKAFTFYKDGLGFSSKEGIQEDTVFFQLQGVWLSLYPKDKLAKDANVPNNGNGFQGIVLAHNVRTKEEVDVLINRAQAAGATVTDPTHDREWGGYSGYFQDLDGYLWEVAWNPHFWVE